MAGRRRTRAPGDQKRHAPASREVWREALKPFLAANAIKPGFIANGLNAPAASRALGRFSLVRKPNDLELRVLGQKLNDPLSLLKMDISGAAVYAADAFDWEDRIGPQHRKAAKNLVPLLRKVNEELSRIEKRFPRRTDHPLFITDFGFVPGHAAGANAASLLQGPEAASQMIESLLKSFTTRGGPSNSDPFPREFIGALAKTWQQWKGRRPARARSGEFVRFVTTVWRLLRLPDWNKDDLEDWLGKRVEGELSRPQFR